MSPRRTILATFHAMLFVQTVGSVDGKHKLPAPKQYVAHCVVWGVLFFMADTGLGKLASRLSMLILLTAMVVGPFGPKAIGFLDSIARSFANVPPAQPGRQPGAQDQTAQPAPQVRYA